MNIKHRVEKLEQAITLPSYQHVALVGVKSGETKDQAVNRWREENPKAKEPDEIIFLIPMEIKKAKHEH